MDSVQKVKKIAVVAVHGVGDQMPFETAHRIGDLLQALNIGERPEGSLPPPAGPQQPVYYPFREHTLRVDVRPTVVRKSGQKQHAASQVQLPEHSRESRGPFNTWVKDCLKKRTSVDDDEIWYEFTKGQLSGYQGDDPEDTYQTVRLEGSRAPQSQAGQDQATVHIYEVYWADLSRLKAGVFSIFTELYQLLFHLPSLGTHTVNAAALHHRTAEWRTFRSLQTYAAGILTVPIPIINLFMAGTIAVVVALTALRNAEAEPVFSAIALALIFTVVVGGLLWVKLAKKQLKTWMWLLPLVLGGAAFGALYYSVAKIPWKWDWPSQIIAGCIVAAIVALLLFLIIGIYDRRRPGALKWAGILGLLVFAAGVGSVFYQPPDPDQRRQLIMFWVRQWEISDIALLFAWGMFFLVGLANLVAGGLAVARTRKTDNLAQRSFWTGLLMLSLPTLSFLIVTVGAWYLVTDYIPRFLPDANYRGLWAARFGLQCVSEMPHALQEHLGRIFKTLLVSAFISAIFAMWGLAPIVWTEVRPPKLSPRSLGDSSRRLGRWLTLGFHGLFVSGVVLYAITMFALPAVSAWTLFAHKDEFLEGYVSLAAFGGTAFATLFLVRGRLKQLVLGFRPILDMLLDVDNWFREHPRDSNPKARICGRYVSLLRYICNWREDSAKDDSGYDGIVIIAHSQGTVITADLLRFLKKESQGNLADYDPELEKLNGIPVFLFTMGCPLRQLYGLRFPHLYHWVRHDDQSVMDPWKREDIPKDRFPNPGDLQSVSLWVNCYRSGDYVGRFLWRTDSCDYLWTGDSCGNPLANPKEYNSTDGNQRLEFCIGAGAHTHYWDRTAPLIAWELDRLINDIPLLRTQLM